MPSQSAVRNREWRTGCGHLGNTAKSVFRQKRHHTMVLVQKLPQVPDPQIPPLTDPLMY